MAIPNGQLLRTRPLSDGDRSRDTRFPIPHSDYENDYPIDGNASGVANPVRGISRSAGKRSHGDLEATGFDR